MNLDLTSLIPSLEEGGIALIAGMFGVFLILALILYIYLSLAFMALGRKAGLTSPALAWIPSFGPLIIAFQASKMHWWPWLLLIVAAVPYAGFVAGPLFMVFTLIWQWKLFDSIGRPGWWVLLNLIPLVGSFIWLILLGVAAWSKE